MLKNKYNLNVINFFFRFRDKFVINNYFVNAFNVEKL